jgi:hypothetical protein
MSHTSVARGEAVSLGRNPAAGPLAGQEVSLFLGEGLVARFRLSNELGRYDFVEDEELLRYVLFSMSTCTLWRGVPMRQAAPSTRAAPLDRGSVALRRDDVSARLRRLAVQFAEQVQSLVPSDEDASELWRPSGLHDEQAAILNYGGRRPLTAAEAQELLQLTRQGLAQRRRSGRLLGLPVGPRRILYPAWQFDRGRTSKLLSGMEAILAAAPRDNPWAVADVLTTRQPSIGDAIPIEVLRNGEFAREHLEEMIGLVEHI